MLFVIGCIAWLTLRKPPEPGYDGVSLSSWLNEFNQSAIDSNAKTQAVAAHAIQQIGTNGLPLLLRLAGVQVRSTLLNKLMLFMNVRPWLPHMKIPRIPMT